MIFYQSAASKSVSLRKAATAQKASRRGVAQPAAKNALRGTRH